MIRIVTEEEVHMLTIKELGVLENVDKTIQEMEELTKCLVNYKIMYIAGTVDDEIKDEIYRNIEEEIVDVRKCLNKMVLMMGLNVNRMLRIGKRKMKRTYFMVRKIIAERRG
jgi:hypothetical protein